MNKFFLSFDLDGVTPNFCGAVPAWATTAVAQLEQERREARDEDRPESLVTLTCLGGQVRVEERVRVTTLRTSSREVTLGSRTL